MEKLKKELLKNAQWADDRNMFQIQICNWLRLGNDEYKKYNVFYNKERCGVMSTHNGTIIHFDINILISGYYYYFFYIKNDNRLSIRYNRGKSPIFYNWCNCYPLKEVDKKIREKLKILLKKLDDSFEPFTICKKIINDYFEE